MLKEIGWFALAYDLLAVMQAWHTLSEVVRAGIVAMVKAVGGGTSATSEGGESA